MGRTTEIQFAINSYKAKSGLMSSERLVNFYPEPAPSESPFRGSITGVSGLTIWKDLSQFEPIYGMIKMINDIYVVCGLTVYKINASKTATTLGTLSGTPGRVMMTENGTQVTITLSNGDSYFATTSTLTKITDVDYPSSTSCTTLNGYTVVTKTETAQFFISALNDTSSWAALDFATAEARSDNLVRAFANNNELWLFGTETTEIWNNTGNVLFPFARLKSAFIEIGCAAKFSVAKDQDGLFWLGDDFAVYQAVGYQAVPISTDPIQEEFESYSTVSDAFGMFHIQGGRRFYTLSFPSAGKTWVYDTTMRLWHERESRNADSLLQERWLANGHVFFDGLNLIGDKNTGIIYEIDPDVYTENGTAIIGEITTATLFSDYSRNNFDRLTLVMDTGVGIDGSGQGDDPEIMLQTSSDGGQTYTNEMWQKIGKIGSYETEVSWTNIGHGRSLISRLRISDPVKRVIVGAYINQEVGIS